MCIHGNNFWLCLHNDVAYNDGSEQTEPLEKPVVQVGGGGLEAGTNVDISCRLHDGDGEGLIDCAMIPKDVDLFNM